MLCPGGSDVAPRRSGPALTYAAIGAGTAAAHIGNNFTTYLVGGLIDTYGFRASVMGAFAMLETLAYGAAMLGVARWAAGSSSPRRLAACATLLVIVAQAASAATGALVPLLAGRIVTGFGFGLMNAAVNLAAGRTARPTQAISVGIACQTVLFALVNLVLPAIAARHGLPAMFLALAALSLVLGVVTMGMPAAGPASDAGEVTERVTVRATGPALPPGSWRLLLAMALFAGGSLAIWPFMERAGHAIGLSASRFGLFQSVATLASAAGNALLAMLLPRLPRRATLASGLLACAASCAVLTTTTHVPLFAGALIVFNASWFVAYPMLLDLSYTLEAQGRLAVLMTGTWLLAQSAGALAAGFLADATGSFAGVGMVGGAGCAAALLLAVPVSGRRRQPSRRA